MICEEFGSSFIIIIFKTPYDIYVQRFEVGRGWSNTQRPKGEITHYNLRLKTDAFFFLNCVNAAGDIYPLYLALSAWNGSSMCVRKPVY